MIYAPGRYLHRGGLPWISPTLSKDAWCNACVRNWSLQLCECVFLRFFLIRFISIFFCTLLCVFAGYSTFLHMISCVCIVWCVFLCFCALGVLLGATCVSVIAPCSASCVILFVFMYSHVFSCVFCLLLLIFIRFSHF